MFHRSQRRFVSKPCEKQTKLFEKGVLVALFLKIIKVSDGKYRYREEYFLDSGSAIPVALPECHSSGSPGEPEVLVNNLRGSALRRRGSLLLVPNTLPTQYLRCLFLEKAQVMTGS